MKTLSPLESIKFFVLLALAKEPMRGYGVGQQVRADSSGMHSLGSSTIYFTLKSLQASGHIEVASVSQTRAQTRTAYRLTDKGHKVLRQQAVLLGTASQIAARRLHY